ncbi:hypothetical protein HY496_02590 [Candidatus Woesearchaeota archaeon]|nr:hypothetical protein [Candidatus Woesearchaeota archaeon]
MDKRSLGLDYIQTVQTQEVREVGKKNFRTLFVPSSFISTAIVAGMFWNESPLDHEFAFFGSLAAALASSFGISYAVGRSSELELVSTLKDHDSYFLKSYDSFRDLVRDENSFQENTTLRELGSLYKDALRLDCIVEKIHQTDVEEVLRLQGCLSPSAQEHATSLTREYLAKAPSSALESYFPLLAEGDLVRLARHYIADRELSLVQSPGRNEPILLEHDDPFLGSVSSVSFVRKRLPDAERVARDARVSTRIRGQLFVEISIAYLSQGEQVSAERLWDEANSLS